MSIKGGNMDLINTINVLFLKNFFPSGWDLKKI